MATSTRNRGTISIHFDPRGFWWFPIWLAFSDEEHSVYIDAHQVFNHFYNMSDSSPCISSGRPRRGSSAAVPAEIAGHVTCCSGGRGRVAVGCDDGTVGLLDRGFRLSYGFQAYASSALFLQQLKVFDLDKVQEEGSSTTSPFCVQILRVFTDQFPQAKITSFMVLEEAPPILLIAIGLDNGFIYCIKGDIARERITRFKLQVEAASDGSTSLPITGLGFRIEGQATSAFCCNS
ncbi:hypothetical protein HU200_026969 [Digitaria exilis]|uniref:Uncharacterized protein n=1 Tax=Digitaria exilis TaxID=1010633 RepID=A0A835BZ34_9POAL|nr:hypothetical protein HU200_026969 [Digitaria exilis]